MHGTTIKLINYTKCNKFKIRLHFAAGVCYNPCNCLQSETLQKVVFFAYAAYFVLYKMDVYDVIDRTEFVYKRVRFEPN